MTTTLEPGAPALSVVYRPVGELVPYARNARTHTDAQVEEIAGSIRRFGFTNPVLVRPDGGIIAGHGRVRAAKLLGLDTVPTIVLAGLSDVQIRALTLADNRIALNAGWDAQLLSVELADLRQLGASVDGLGFTGAELKSLLKLPSAGESSDESPPPTLTDATIHEGDALEVLRTLGAESARCCVTSPPYWGLRDYGHAGQYGLERTLDEYISRMVAVFAEVRRVLKRDGTLWLNLGDSYVTPVKGLGSNSKKQLSNAGSRYLDPHLVPPTGSKVKDLAGVPWTVALALRAAGWWLRSDIIWSKPGPMPESVVDRPTKAHEYLFLLAKAESYYYNAEAVKEPAKKSWNSADMIDSPLAGTKDAAAVAQGLQTRGGTTFHRDEERTDRNRRTVWTITQATIEDAHFAVMPTALVEPCILAGSEPGDMVLDPFAGAGTTGLVALQHRRRFVGIELLADYRALALRRIARSLEGKPDILEQPEPAGEAAATS